mmetsp:Transcript_2884/g.5705  ORF Transcript_2884/g.5705 Transcript_2884/m.5705 type:complete len:258 (+) Transcript_2884:105-878(+)
MKLSSVFFTLAALPVSTAFPFSMCGLRVEHSQLARVGNTRTITAQATIRNDGFFTSSDVTISSSVLDGPTKLGAVKPFGSTKTFVKSFTLPKDVSCEKFSIRLQSDYCDETITFPSICVDPEDKPEETTHEVELMDSAATFVYPDDFKRVNLEFKGQNFPEQPRLTAGVIIKEASAGKTISGHLSVIYMDGTQSGKMGVSGVTDANGRVRFVYHADKEVRRFKIVVENSNPPFVCKSEYDNVDPLMGNCFLRGPEDM